MVASTSSVFARITNYRWRNLPALLGGLVTAERDQMPGNVRAITAAPSMRNRGDQDDS
jgi:hypothetical protein